MTDYKVVTGACEICTCEYITEESKKLSDLPLNQSKASKIHRILHAALLDTKPCVSYPCKDQLCDNIVNHFICEKHLYQMIDALHALDEDKI